MEKILLVIPAYNEAENIPWVIEELQQLENVYDYVIINDGSKDNTKLICEEKGYHYVDMPINVGWQKCLEQG